MEKMKQWKKQARKFLMMLLLAAAISAPVSRLAAEQWQPEPECSVCGVDDDDEEYSSETIIKG